MQGGNTTYVLFALLGVAVTGLFVLGARWFFAAENPLRVWLHKNIVRHGFFQFSRLVGLVVVTAIFGVLTFVYS